MDGILAVQARIAAIRSVVAPVSAAPPLAAPTSAAAFEGHLSAALSELAPPAAATGPVTAPAAPRPPGSYGRLVPPAELAAHGNGRVPASALAELRTAEGHRLHAPAALQWDRLTTAATADGVTIGITDSYRSLASQEDVARRKGLYKDGGLAAVPGTSAHGWGLAVDVEVDDAGQRWLRANGHRFGFVEDTPREPWHWTFRPEPGTV